MRAMSDDERGPGTWTPEETSESAVETRSDDDGGVLSGGTRRSPRRDGVILALVAASPISQLVAAGGFDPVAFAVAAVVVAVVASELLALAPLAGLDEWLRQVVLLAGIAVGVVGVAWVVFVLGPARVRYASASLGLLAGAAVANLLDRGVIRPPPALT